MPSDARLPSGGRPGKSPGVVQRVTGRLEGRAASRLHSVRDARGAAQRRVPTVVFDYVDGGADDEVTMRRNAAAFAGVTFRPRMAGGPFDPALETSVLGTRLALPVILAPCGLVRLLHPDGAAGAARAAGRRGTVSVLSTVAGTPVEEVAAAAGVPMWFQLYAAGGLEEAERLCDQAADAGIEVLVVTVDTPSLGNRLRDVHNGVAPPLRVDAHNVVPLGAQVLRRPLWAVQLAATGIRLSRRGAGPSGHGSGMLQAVASPFSWADVSHLRSRWPGHLVVKGVLGGEDARNALDAGADAVVVSNHGGRQLDGAPATLEVLPEIVASVGDDAEVLVDGGIRRGADVVAALAMGARAVLIGRPYLYGLAAAGQPGVERVLSVLEAEMRRTMLLLGCRSVEELDARWLAPPHSGGARLQH